MKGLVRYSVLWLCILGTSAVCAQETPPRQAWSF
ncbi:Uncharacterised protein [Citrobacter koseri]|nr:Uncharacterised protein [Citrobacter koseri]